VDAVVQCHAGLAHVPRHLFAVLVGADRGEQLGGYAETGEPDGDVQRCATGRGLDRLPVRADDDVDQRLPGDQDGTRGGR
jgi:hypothetical protein